MSILILIALVSVIFWIVIKFVPNNSQKSTHNDSFYSFNKTETDKHIERISYQTNANYMNNLIQQIKGGKYGNQ
ncbi:hypothetical protein EBR43_03815 [bacterium]|nr:hypothetical protein [bacterium]